MKEYLNYINGEWRPAISGATTEVINPANGKVIGKAARSGEEDLELAINAAHESFYGSREWRDMPAQDRADILFKVADLLEEAKPELKIIETENHGKPVRESEADIDDIIHVFKYYAGLITKPSGGCYEVNDGFGPMHSYTLHEPIGVCGLITPWNYPLLIATWKLAPALAAGNSVILKPATITPASMMTVFDIFEKAGIPKGAANLILGPGGKIGNSMAESKMIDCLTFTGSTVVGQSIMRAAASNVKKIGLELGGKSPCILFDDIDIERAVEWAMIGIFLNQGEICSACSRLIVHEDIHDEFVKRFVERANNMTIGDPMNDPDIGPIVSQEQLDTVLRYIEIGKKEGAKCLCGGERYTADGCADGFFVRPTIFDDCTPDMTIVKEEIFGPVVVIQKFKTEEEAIELANNTDYGLAGAVFTNDHMRAIRVVKELRAGITWINCNQPCFCEAPWGGYKMSGVGRDLGPYGLEEYQEVKQINDSLDPGLVGWYTN